jgi:hypothetical protein
MLGIAQKSVLSQDLYSDLNQISNSFDFSYSLFDVFSYQYSDALVEIFLEQISRVTSEEGWILIDGWHSSGLALSPAENRSRSFLVSGETITRRVVVLPSSNQNLTSLEITLFNENSKTLLAEETHVLRAFSKDEVELLLQKFGFRDVKFMDGSQYMNELTSSSWKFAVLFRNCIKQ